MTKATTEVQEKMDQRKKKNESLENKQMKRYYRSLKRKARRENQNVVPMEKVDKPVKRGPSCPNGGKEPEVADLVVPVDPPENDLDLNDKEKLWVEKMNQLNTERSREDKTKTEQCQDDSADSPEFSPIVYWKEPFPEVLPLEIEEKPEKVPADSAPSSCPAPGNLTASSSTPRSSQESRALSSCLVSSVWLDRYKYEDAEAKFYQQKNQEEKSEPTKPPKPAKPAKPAMEEKVRPPLPSKPSSPKLEQEEDDRTFEDHLEKVARDNLEIRKTIRGLTDCVMQLQERIKNLEQENKKLSSSLSETRSQDAGPDLGLTFRHELEPCEGSLTSTSGSSLYSGSEFEEFLPTKGRSSAVSGQITAWKEDWEDVLPSQDHSAMLAQQRKYQC